MSKTLEMKMTKEPRFIWCKLEWSEIPDREEAFFYFESEWRGRAVEVCLEANRYGVIRDGSPGMSEWRVVTHDCRYLDDDGNRISTWEETPTDTAKQRLGEAARPIVEAWIEKNEYAAESRGLYEALISNADANAYGLDVWRRKVEKLRDRFDVDQNQALARIEAAWQEWNAAQEAARVAS